MSFADRNENLLRSSEMRREIDEGRGRVRKRRCYYDDFPWLLLGKLSIVFSIADTWLLEEESRAGNGSLKTSHSLIVAREEEFKISIYVDGYTNVSRACIAAFASPMDIEKQQRRQE